MPSKKTPSGGGRANGAARAAWVPDWERITQAGTTAGTIIIMGGLIVGLTLGRGPLQSRAAEIRGKQGSALKVVFAWPLMQGGTSRDDRPGQAATWLDPMTRLQMENLALSIISPDPFDSASLDRAQVALMKTGWFAKPCVVRRGSDAVVRVEGTWRTPYAVVRGAGGDRWVTYKGEALDKVFPEGTSGLCAVVGIKSKAPASVGETWAGGDVQAALSLVQYIRVSPGFDQVVAIDAGEYLTKNKKQLAILTRYNSRIVWGGPVDQPLPGEWTSAAKLKQLGENVARTGRIDAGKTAIDIRGLGGLTFSGDAPGSAAPTNQQSPPPARR